MDYEKKYKEALEMAKVAALNGHKNLMEGIFLELRESEDERIRKSLISFLKSPFVNENITDEKVAPWIAWLEKQGQKPTAWDKEDDTKLRQVEYACMKFYGGDCSHIGWLRKLTRPQNHWKPTDEQMKALDSAIDEFDGYQEFGSLVSLEEDLEKLKRG